ncbi:hypothetical protein N9F40_00970 [bacterium]|nr:hypothetical protein [bacterium]
MMTGAQNADRAKLIQRGTLESLGKDLARYARTPRRVCALGTRGQPP